VDAEETARRTQVSLIALKTLYGEKDQLSAHTQPDSRQQTDVAQLM